MASAGGLCWWAALVAALALNLGALVGAGATGGARGAQAREEPLGLPAPKQEPEPAASGSGLASEAGKANAGQDPTEGLAELLRPLIESLQWAMQEAGQRAPSVHSLAHQTGSMAAQLANTMGNNQVIGGLAGGAGLLQH